MGSGGEWLGFGLLVGCWRDGSPVGFARYSRDCSFAVLSRNRAFVLVMGAGSIVGTFIGGRMLGPIPSFVLLPLLAAVLLVSAVKVWRHPAT